MLRGEGEAPSTPCRNPPPRRRRVRRGSHERSARSRPAPAAISALVPVFPAPRYPSKPLRSATASRPMVVAPDARSTKRSRNASVLARSMGRDPTALSGDDRSVLDRLPHQIGRRAVGEMALRRVRRGRRDRPLLLAARSRGLRVPATGPRPGWRRRPPVRRRGPSGHMPARSPAPSTPGTRCRGCSRWPGPGLCRDR